MNKNFRLNLDEKAHEKLKQMSQIIEKNNSEVKLTRPLLNSWIINWFFENQFERQKKQIVIDHFDPLKRLEGLLKTYKSKSGSKNINHKDLIKQLNSINSKLKKTTASETSSLPVVEITTD